MKNALIVLLAVIIGWAAFHYRAALFGQKPEPASGTSGVKGEARLGPTCPAVRRSEPGSGECADKLYQADFVVYKADTAIEVARFSSDENGVFQISLPPGEYAIRNVSTGPYPKCGGTGIVPVEEGKHSEIIVFCDTGIR